MRCENLWALILAVCQFVSLGVICRKEKLKEIALVLQKIDPENLLIFV
jgi:hypothetical protein